MGYGKRDTLRFTRTDIWDSVGSSNSMARARVSRRKKKAHSSRKSSSFRKSKKRPGRHSARRGKIHYAKKTGQPYIILSNGRAKFIKGKRKK